MKAHRPARFSDNCCVCGYHATSEQDLDEHLIAMAELEDNDG